MKNKLKEMRGITLIALVITIIVLLILAGVSIATLTGENGILTQAQSSKTETKKSEAEEIFKLIANEWQIEKRTNKKADLSDFLGEKVKEYGDKLSFSGNEAPYTLTYNGEEIQINNDGTLKEVSENQEPTVLEAGLYDESYNLKYTWQQLLDNNYIHVKDGALSPINGTNQENGDPIYYLEGILVVDESVTSIPRYAFNSYWKRLSIILPDSVISIGESAFEGSDLQSINIPDSVTSIGSAAFFGCDFTSISISSKVTALNASTFASCVNMESVTIPKTVSVIREYVFSDCNKLTTINYNGSKDDWNAIEFYDLWLGDSWSTNNDVVITVHCTDGDIEILARTK